MYLVFHIHLLLTQKYYTVKWEGSFSCSRDQTSILMMEPGSEQSQIPVMQSNIAVVMLLTSLTG